MWGPQLEFAHAPQIICYFYFMESIPANMKILREPPRMWGNFLYFLRILSIYSTVLVTFRTSLAKGQAMNNNYGKLSTFLLFYTTYLSDSWRQTKPTFWDIPRGARYIFIWKEEVRERNQNEVAYLQLASDQMKK